MQRSSHGTSTFPPLALCSPVLLQRLPHWSPILRCRFQNYFLDLLLDQPFGQQLQLVRATAELSPLKIVFPFDSNIGHHYGQHLLMNIDSRYPVRHKSS